MYNAKELVDKGIVTGPILEKNVQMHGVDLNLIAVKRVLGGGHIPLLGKTVLGSYEDVPVVDGMWKLDPGVYDITFAQGCKIPNDIMMLIRQRSSLLRNGTFLHSSVFDAGFETEQMGTVMTVQLPITIEEGARVAQIYSHQGTPVGEDRLYTGQWQGDKQREYQK
jgi:dUTP pyrophosphatase